MKGDDGTARPNGSTLRAMIKHVVLRAIREPVVQFLLLGSIAWFAVQVFSNDSSSRKIEIGPSERALLADGYARRFGFRPDDAQVKHLIDQYISDEIAFREGLAMGLDQGDEIVRRRVIQKYKMLLDDRSVPKEPSENDLVRWYTNNRERYRTPNLISFSHIYFSTASGAAQAQKRAQTALNDLGQKPYKAFYDDIFPGPSSGEKMDVGQISAMFGRSPLAAQIHKFAPGRWEGPIRSGYGWHLVRVTSITPSRIPTLSEVREQALADYAASERDRKASEILGEVRSKYTILQESDERR